MECPFQGPRLPRSRRWRPGAATWGIILAVVLLYVLGLGNHTLWGFEEPYVGATIREMAVHRNFVVPTLNGHPFLEKPPLAYILGALACRAVGHFEPWALRMPSAALAVATSVGVSFLARRLGAVRTAPWAGVTLATSLFFFEVGHAALVDMTHTAAVTLALGMAFLALAEPHRRGGPGRRCWWSTGCPLPAQESRSLAPTRVKGRKKQFIL